MGDSSTDEPGALPDERVTVDELLALLDPTKQKATAHLVFLKAEYTPVAPVVSEQVRGLVDEVGYFRLAKALLDVRTDENGQALAGDIADTLQQELNIARADAVAIVHAVSDSKNMVKRAQVFAQQMERFSELVANSRDKVVASAAEAKVKVEEKMDKAKVKVATRAAEASKKLQSLVADDHTVKALCHVHTGSPASIFAYHLPPPLTISNYLVPFHRKAPPTDFLCRTHHACNPHKDAEMQTGALEVS